MTRIAVCGAAGRMGRQIVALIAAAEDLALSGALEYSSHPDLGNDAGTVAGVGALGVPLSAHVGPAAAASDVVVDFSHAGATLEVARAVAGAGKALVIGTTGHESAEREAIAEAIAKIPAVWAPNMSVGVSVLFKLAAQAARALGPTWDVEVTEIHHRHKKDAPSGTAMRLGEILAEELGTDLGRAGVFARHGMTGERKAGTIGLQSLRGGDEVGEHTALYLSDGERLEITHRATSRAIFARGALRAARWVAGQKPGLYDMSDVLGLEP